MFCCYFWKTYCDKLIFRIRINTWQMFFSFSPLAADIEGNDWLEFFICGCSYKIDFEASGIIWEREQLCLQRWYSGVDQELGWTLAYVPIAISSGPENSAAALLFKLCCYVGPSPALLAWRHCHLTGNCWPLGQPPTQGGAKMSPFGKHIHTLRGPNKHGGSTVCKEKVSHHVEEHM